MARVSPTVTSPLLLAIPVSLGLFALTSTRREERGASPLFLQLLLLLFLGSIVLSTVGSLVTVGAALAGQSIIDVASLSFAVSGVLMTPTVFRL